MPKEVMDEEEQERPEEEREEKARGPQKAEAPVVSAELFNRLARVWVFLTAFFLAGTVYYLVPVGTFLWEPMSMLDWFGPDEVEVRDSSPPERHRGEVTLFTELRDGVEVRRVQIVVAGGEVKTFDRDAVRVTERRIPIRPMLPVCAALFAAFAWGLFRVARGKLDYQKPGQGRWVRLAAYLGLGSLSVFAAVGLYRTMFLKIPKESAWLAELWSTQILGVQFKLMPILHPAAAILFTGVLVWHLYSNRPGQSDYLVETQGELRKVSWPARREWIGSTIVVVVVVAIVSVFLYLVDQGLSYVSRELGIGF